MNKKKAAYTYTSESVTEGHPDKMCDQIADAILDAILTEDKDSRVAVEVTASDGFIHVFGEVTTKARVDFKKVVRDTIDEIGYRADELSTDGEFYRILINLNKQSVDIAMGVNGRDTGAGDQGMMFGYACDETEELMPLTAVLAHKLCLILAEVRKLKIIPYLKPDGKAQVSIEYSEDNIPLRVKGVLVSTQHKDGVDISKLRENILRYVIKNAIPEELMDENTKVLINPTGRFVLGGPAADSGLTGRKIIVDTYGSRGRHGGGSFSGKDATKVDRSGAYLARYIAKNIVAAGLAKECEVQISYAIGISNPMSFNVSSFGTGIVSDIVLTNWILSILDMKPRKIINTFELYKPIYRQFTAYGHFGREKMLVNESIAETPWEKTDLAPILKKLARDYFGKKGDL
jgi:S-adenosylmethionine synthetase